MRIFISNFNGIFNNIEAFVKAKGDYCDLWVDADVLLLWQDVVGNMPEVAQQAKEMGKRVYVAEHGLLSINDYIPPLNRPLVADKFFAWGERTKRWMVELAKIDPERIVVAGTTLFDEFKPKKLHTGKNVVFAPRHWDSELEENVQIAEELRKLKGINVYSKIIENEHDPKLYPNPIQSNRLNVSHLELCWQVLSTADVVVTLGEGTFASMAYYLDIPVISSSRWDTKELLGKTYDKAEFFSQVTGACSIVSPERLNRQIIKELEHPELNRKARYDFLVDNVNYLGDKSAAEIILREIYET
jgi:hypothetical protein